MPAPALQHGPYVTPPVIKGCRVVCGVRGVVRLVGLSSGAIPWPVGERDGERALVVYRGLARALRSESAGDVAAAWGVPVTTVEEWQRAIEDPPPDRDLRPTLNAARRWTPEDDKALLAEPDDAKAAKRLHRTVDAIKFHRWLLREKRAIAKRLRNAKRKKSHESVCRQDRRR
jgi:hypothetical protein